MHNTWPFCLFLKNNNNNKTSKQVMQYQIQCWHSLPVSRQLSMCYTHLLPTRSEQGKSNPWPARVTAMQNQDTYYRYYFSLGDCKKPESMHEVIPTYWPESASETHKLSHTSQSQLPSIFCCWELQQFSPCWMQQIRAALVAFRVLGWIYHTRPHIVGQQS